MSLLLLLSGAFGCYSPKKKVDQSLRRLQFEWQTNVVHQVALPDWPLNWTQAVAQLEAGNLKLRRARADITNGQENVRQVFKDLMPALNFRGGVSKSLETLPATSIDDVTFNVDSFFNVPGFVNLSTRLFAARLILLRANLYYDVGKREQTIELYKLFLAFDDADAAEAQLKQELAFAQAIEQVDSLAGKVLLRDLNLRMIGLSKEREALQEKAGDVFGSMDWHWNLVKQGMPDLHYETNALELLDTNHVGQAQLRLAAVELVAAWARIKGIQLQYWPELTLFITGPPVYQRSSGNEAFWDVRQVRANANFFWRIDTRGAIATQLRQTRRDQELQLARLRQDGILLIEKMLAAQKLMVALGEEIAQLDAILPLVSQVPVAMDYAGITESTEKARSLRDQERKLRRELAEINTLFWFVDDTRWPAHE